MNNLKYREKNKCVGGREAETRLACPNQIRRPPHASRQIMELCNNQPQQLADLNFRQQQQQLEMNRRIQPAGLETSVKTPKLAGSKSLSRLTKSLFFRSKQPTKEAGEARHPVEGMKTTRSMPNCPTIVNSTAIDLTTVECQQVGKTKRKSSLLPVLGNSSKCSTSNRQNSLDQPNVSPIVGLNGACQKTVESLSMSPIEVDISGSPKEAQGEGSSETKKRDENATGKKKFKPFKGTSLVLRDVKNSLTLVSVIIDRLSGQLSFFP